MYPVETPTSQIIFLQNELHKAQVLYEKQNFTHAAELEKVRASRENTLQVLNQTVLVFCLLIAVLLIIAGYVIQSIQEKVHQQMRENCKKCVLYKSFKHKSEKSANRIHGSHNTINNYSHLKNEKTTADHLF